MLEHADLTTAMAAPQRPAAADRRHRHAARRRPVRPATSTASRCSTWTTCAASPMPASPSASARSTRARALIEEELARYRTLTTAREAAPLVTALRDHAESIRRDELERVDAPTRRARRPPARRRRSTDEGDRGQAAPRSDRAAQGRVGHRKGRSSRGSAARPVRPLTLRVATRGSALARWQAEHVASLLRAVDPERRRRARDRRHDRRSPPGRRHLADGRQGRVRQGGAGRGARRPRRHRRALGQGPAVVRSSTGSCWRRSPSAAKCATRWWVRRWTAIPSGRTGGHRFGPSPGAARRPPAGPHLRRSARQHPDARSSEPSEHDAVVIAAVALERLGRAEVIAELLADRRDGSAGRAKARSRSSVARTTTS